MRFWIFKVSDQRLYAVVAFQTAPIRLIVGGVSQTSRGVHGGVRQGHLVHQL
jgi:hypothetical protein